MEVGKSTSWSVTIIYVHFVLCLLCSQYQNCGTALQFCSTSCNVWTEAGKGKGLEANFEGIPNLAESQNVLSWKAPTRTIQSNSRLHTGSLKNQIVITLYTEFFIILRLLRDTARLPHPPLPHHGGFSPPAPDSGALT